MLDISYRVRNLIIAGALAICAVALMLVYVSHARKHSTSASSKSVPVYVATRDIPIGTTGQTLASGNWMQLRNLPADSVASGVVATPAQLRTFVAIQPTYAGEQIVARRFGTIQQEGLLSDLKGTARVIELPGDAHQLLAGTLKQGNRVDVVGNLATPEGGQTHDTLVALRNLLVVKAPSAPSSTASDQTLSVDLQLTGDQADRLYWLQRNGNWALLLRPSNNASDTKLAPTTAASVIEASSGR